MKDAPKIVKASTLRKEREAHKARLARRDAALLDLLGPGNPWRGSYPANWKP